MLSRVACVPRICLSCRLGILQTRAALSVPAPSSYRDGPIRRHYHARDSVVQSKERIEALISGRIVESKEKKKDQQSQKRKKGSRRKTSSRDKGKGKGKANARGKGKAKANEDDDLPDWGFNFVKDKKGFKVQLPKRQDAEVLQPIVEEPKKAQEPVIEEPLVKELEMPEPEAQEPQLEGSQVEESHIEEAQMDIPFIEDFEIKEAVEEDLEPPKPESTETIPSPVRRRYRDKLVQSRQLGKDALGRPLDALMVRNPNKMRKPRKPARMLEEEKPAQAVNLKWQDLMPKIEEHDDLMNEAMENIEALRPVDSTILSLEDFDDLQRQLVEGYTYNQLVAYFHRKLKKLDKYEDELPKYDWIIEATPWEPSLPDHWEKTTPKFNYAIMITRRLWHIEIKEQVEGLGRLQIWLRPEVFKLITGPSSQVLRSLSAKYLYKSNKERIEGSVDESRLDIFARKSIMPVFLARLDEIASSMTSQKVSVRDLKEEDLAPKMLQEAARITGTLIQYDKENAELQVSWLANDGRPTSMAKQGTVSSQTESPADIMLRLLMGRQIKESEQQTSVQTLTRPGENGTDSRLFISHQRETRSMSWREKLQSWFRYVSPVSKQQPFQDAEPAADLGEKISLPKSSAKATRSAAATEIVTATFGHILHDKAEAEKTEMASNPRILSPVVPHPAALTPITKEAAQPVRQHTSIILNFTPIPSPPTKTTKSKTKTTTTKAETAAEGHIPDLRLRLPVGPEADLSNISFPPESTLHGILHRHVHDVLLPGGSVDVRLARQTLLSLDVQKQPLREFLSTCDFNLPEGRLRTPSQAHFSVPASWISPTKSRKLVSAAYRFVGLELHQVVEVEWRGHTLRYNSIEAGQHGGQRQEISLQARPPQTDAGVLPLPLDKKEQPQFLQLVEDLALGKYFSWHEGYKSMRERPGKSLALEELDELEEAEAEAEDAVLSLYDETPALSEMEEEEEAQQIPFSTVEDGNTAPSEEPAAENKEDAEPAPTENGTEDSSVPEASSPPENQPPP